MATKRKEVSRETLSVEEAQNLKALQEQDFLKTVLDTYEGRRVIYGILAKGDIYGVMPYGEAEVQRALGRRELAIEVLTDGLTVSPSVYILMQKEAEEFERKYEVKQDMGDLEDGYE